MDNLRDITEIKQIIENILRRLNDLETQTIFPDGSIPTAKIADNAITTGKIAAGAVGTSDIADGAVTASKIEPQQAWITPTFLNSWVNFGGGYNGAGYYKDSIGIVHLRGLVKSGSAGAIFQLPAGYRPTSQCLFPVQTNSNTIGRCDVDVNGNVIFQAGSNVWFSLDNISFNTT